MAAVRISGNDTNCLCYQLGKFQGTSVVFKEFVIQMLRNNFLSEGDVLILDNAKIHSTDECLFLAETLWTVRRVAVLPLPAYSPELNPIELVFNFFGQILKSTNARRIDSSSDFMFLQLCLIILESISKIDLLKMYRKCGYQ